MRGLLTAALMVPLVDQAVKLLLRRSLGSSDWAVGPLMRLRLVAGRIWLTRFGLRPRLRTIWVLWLAAAVALLLVAASIPASAPFAGLVLGGSLSHAAETSLRGTVSDYICLEFWPAFNLADAAITAGAIGVAAHAAIALGHAAI